MTPLDFFLREHSAVHSRSAAGSEFSMDWLINGLSDPDRRPSCATSCVGKPVPSDLR